MTGTVFITGATAGIGQASARRFAAAGYRIVATGRRRERLDAIVAELGEEKVHAIELDMRDIDAVSAAVDALPEPFRAVDILINNAGLARGTEPAQAADLANWRQMIDTNITGLVAITHRLLPGLIERRGVILNLSSIAGTYPYPGGNVYGATKAFVSQFSLNLRCDLHGTGVRVAAIEPGMIETEFTTVRTGSREASDALYRGVDPMTAEDTADILFWIATLPPHININALELMPVNQSFAGFAIHRGESPS
jgi:serine 3-dehydrogenase